MSSIVKAPVIKSQIMRSGWPLLLYALVGLSAVWGVLFTPGTLGHHWDWGIPPSSLFSQHIIRQSSQVWSQQSLGYSFVTVISVLPSLAILGFLSSVGLSGDLLSKGLVILVITTSGYSAYTLLLEITGHLNIGSVPSSLRSYGGAVIGGYFYALSPFLFNEIVGGAYTQFVAYSLSPLAIWAFVRSLRVKKAWEGSLTAAIFLSAVAMSLQYLTIVLLVSTAITFVNGKKGLSAFARLLSLWLPINCYWILPLYFNLQGTLTYASSQYSVASTLSGLQIHEPTLIQAFSGTGYWTDYFSSTLPSSIYPSWIVTIIAFVSLFIGYVLVKLRTPNVFLWTGILLSAITVETGYNSPFPTLLPWLYANFAPMVLFKSPQHLIFPAVLALTVLVGISSASFLKTNSRRKRGTTFVILLLVVSVWVSPFFSGNFGGAVDVYRLPASYSQINSILSADNSSFRILYLPMSGSPLYLANSYQSQNQGGDPTIAYSPEATILSDQSPNPLAKEFAGDMETMLAGTNPPPNAMKLLAFVNVKYIVLRQDIVPNFGPLAANWNYTRVFQDLSNLAGLRLVASYPEASLWVNELPRSPQIYAASNVIYDNPPISGIRNWEELSGAWTAYEQYSVVGSTGTLRSDLTYNDSDFSVETKLLGGNSFDNWVLWHGVDDNNFYYAGQGGIGYFSAGRVVGGVRTEMFSKWMSYTRNQSIWVRIISQGDSYQIFSGSDDKNWTLMESFQDKSFLSGFIGFSSLQVGQFSNATVRDLNGNIIFSDDFSRSNLIQLILSDEFTIGQTAIVPPDARMPNPIDTSAKTTATSSDWTHYLIQVDARGPFYLVDQENFDDGWILELPSVTHLVANGLMNAWAVESGTSERASLIYGPQRLFQYGTIVSIISLASFVTLVIFQKKISRALKLLRIRLRHPEGDERSVVNSH